MNKLFLTTLFISLSAFAAESKPTELTATEQLEVSRQQTSLLQAENVLAGVQLQMQAADKAATEARKKYQAVLDKMREVHHAGPDCDLKTDQTFVCPEKK